MSIVLPPVLESAQKIFDLIDAIVKLDSKKKKEIEDSVKAFHKLNDTEKKKAEDARALIDQYQDLLNSTNNASEQLVKEKELSSKERKQFEDNRRSQLDDIALKVQALHGEKAVLEEETAKLEEVKRQLGVAQASAENIVQRNLEKEASLSRKEQDLGLREKILTAREEEVVTSENKVKHKLAQLRQIAE